MTSLKLLVRVATIGMLIVLLLIPLWLIRGTIHERQRYRDEAVAKVEQAKAAAQRFIAPVRYVPWTGVEDVQVEDAAGQAHREHRATSGWLIQAPQQLQVGGSLVPSERRIGLFRVPVYSWRAQVRAQYAPLSLPAVPGRRYGQPGLALGMSDVRGLVGTPNLRVEGQPLPLQPGPAALAGQGGGLHAALPVAEGAVLPAIGQLDMEFVLDGTRSLQIAPIGASNRISLASPWPHPSFGGRFLPNQRRIDRNGFDAQWNLSSLAIGDPAALLARGETPASLQVDLVDPVDVYTMTDRASKYGLLFVLLTFVGFALLEMLKRLPIHPLQYLLVGLALAIFFLLLLGLSEHIPFWQAYLAASAACIGLQFFYLTGVLGGPLRAGGFAAMLAALYAALYSLLASEDNALLMGSLLLFGILAAIMWATRRVDWYALGRREGDRPEAGALGQRT